MKHLKAMGKLKSVDKDIHLATIKTFYDQIVIINC